MNDKARNKDEGIPGNGGQYAETVSGTPQNTSLPNQYVGEGTFLFPPVFDKNATANDVIDFFATVPIDDSVLSKFDNLWAERNDTLANPKYLARVYALTDKKMAAWDAERAAFTNSPEYQAKWKGATELGRATQLADDAAARLHNSRVFEAEARKEEPPPDFSEVDPADNPYPAIHRSQVRTLVRAAAMHAYTPVDPSVFDQQERELVMNHEIDLGYGDILTVDEIENRYRLSEMNGFLFE